jgi:hypothetical protein
MIRDLRRGFFRPSGACSHLSSVHPRLAPLRQAQGKLWAAFFRRFAAFNESCQPNELRTTAMASDNLIDHAGLEAVAEQMMRRGEVVVEGRSFRVTRTGLQRLRTTRFLMGGREYQAIEQNPEKPSRWGKLAREGHRVVQFRDLETEKYVAVAVDGKIKEYGR